MRDGVNRLLMALLLGALAVAAAWTAIEVAARLAGRAEPLLGVDYEALWADVQGWDPGTAVRLVIFLGMALVGLGLLALQLAPERDGALIAVGDDESGPVELNARSIAPYLRSRVTHAPWVRSSSARVRLSGTGARVSDRPETVRPWDPEELEAVRAGLADDVRRLGLDPETVQISPRPPSGRGSTEVR
jgi:hypothetical protein